MISYFASFSLFAFIAAITPGPTNIISLSTGMRADVRSALPFMFGSASGAGMLLFLTCLGMTEIFKHYPSLRIFITLAGSIWLSWMAWKLFNLNAAEATSLEKLPTWQDGAILQFINPKTWMTTLSMSSLFYSTHLDQVTNAVSLGLIFFAITCPCMLTWAAMGKYLQQHIKSTRHQRLIYKTLSLLLLMTVWGLVYDVLS
ncbi:LysE family translocator [Terasakiella sp. A23]|uniref:LysE family translocator n=1 Tax=Terasakiella sp. FCG-A23 TaxID=3080561 RepID=UPI0029532ACB|nr:LysE family translocator [Terasakiella sp. A23]MDV7338497.1 LysE family translocator [Terasakiella sp. A23]